MKVKVNNFMRKFISGCIICFMVLCLTGCKDEKQKKEVAKPKDRKSVV